MKHNIPPIERRRWCAIPQFLLDLEFDSVPPISKANAIANITLFQIIIPYLVSKKGNYIEKCVSFKFVPTRTGQEKQQPAACYWWNDQVLPWTRCKHSR